VRLGSIPERAALPVPILGVAMDARPSLIDVDPAGLVVAAAGGGNTPPDYLDLARPLIAAGTPVVLTTRCPSGRVMSGYAFPGGSSQWWQAGAIFSGTLDALKARVLVALGVGAGASVAEIAQSCSAFGGGRLE
jgi:L-asparaginase